MALPKRFAAWVGELVMQIESGEVGEAFTRVGLAALPLVALLALVIILVVYTLSDAATRSDDDDDGGGGGGGSGARRRPGGQKEA